MSELSAKIGTLLGLKWEPDSDHYKLEALMHVLIGEDDMEMSPETAALHALEELKVEFTRWKENMIDKILELTNGVPKVSKCFAIVSGDSAPAFSVNPIECPSYRTDIAVLMWKKDYNTMRKELEQLEERNARQSIAISRICGALKDDDLNKARDIISEVMEHGEGEEGISNSRW